LNSVETVLAPAQAVDRELRDAGLCGPELAHRAAIYCDSPRALVFRAPSPDWPMMLLVLPLASRLSLLCNPIFAALARNWGLGVRFIGIDRDRLVYDFRALLGDRTLALLIELLAQCERGSLRNEAPVLDVLFDALAARMLTTLERRRRDWARHLDLEHRLEPGAAGSLFAHEDRHPDFLAGLRQALREHSIDNTFYGKVLRSIDAREAEVDAHLKRIVLDELDSRAMMQLETTGAGLHLGCYNWLRLAPRHAHARAHLLTRLPWLARFLAETLVPIEASLLGSAEDEPQPEGDDPPKPQTAPWAHGTRAGLAAFLNAPGGLTATADRSARDRALRHAIDGGQDRAVIEALAERFGVGASVLRRLWREPPIALGTPPAWLMPTLIRRLAMIGERDWPRRNADWQALIEDASDRALTAT
jgi:hypothetical protein